MSSSENEMRKLTLSESDKATDTFFNTNQHAIEKIIKDQLEKTMQDFMRNMNSSGSSSTFVPPPVTTVVSPPVVTTLTYADYLTYRSQHPGPRSNKSFLSWVRNGGEDYPHFRWHPYSGAGSINRGHQERRRGNRGGSSGSTFNYYLN
ncbi:uncharacterized protein LOC124816781 [Hydra vulgaris]|uniref:uncharacterized protein LOC124816781 n=1 Tax=Hydra vulgaris TaxID=6087 RepID=UPI0032EA8BDE